MEATIIESKAAVSTRAPAITASFISSYWGVSDYRVEGITGRVSWRPSNKERQASYGEKEPQLVGTVVNELDPVSEEVLAFFQTKQDDLRTCLPDMDKLYVPKLTTAKWYPYLGWVCCEIA